MASFRATKLQAELPERLNQLLQGSRPLIESLPADAVAFHRLPPENFDSDGRLVECGVRSPDQSVTIGPFGDEYDALLEIGADSGFSGFKMDCGVVYITDAQLRAAVAKAEQGKGAQPVCFGAKLQHDPYKANYAHGNILSTRDGVPKLWSDGAKKSLRKQMAGHMGKQIALLPEASTDDATNIAESPEVAVEPTPDPKPNELPSPPSAEGHPAPAMGQVAAENRAPRGLVRRFMAWVRGLVGG